MNHSFKDYSHDNLIRISTGISVGIIVLHGLLVLVMQAKLPPFVPLFNSMPWGDARLAPSLYVILLPFFLCIFFLLNTFLGALVYKKNILAARILSFNSLLFAGLSLIAYIGILFLIF